MVCDSGRIAGDVFLQENAEHIFCEVYFPLPYMDQNAFASDSLIFDRTSAPGRTVCAEKSGSGKTKIEKNDKDFKKAVDGMAQNR